jgi:transposase
MYDHTKLVSESVWEELLHVLPTPKQRQYGRKRLSKQALLNGILQVLINGVRWNNIAECGASGVSCWRYFQEVQRRGKLKVVFEALSKTRTDITECALDTTTVTSFRFTHMTGWSGKHKKIGTKVSILTDKNGLPVDVLFGKGNTDDRVFLLSHVEKTVGRRKRILNLDKGYTSIDMRRELRQKGIQVNMETRKNDYIHKKGPKFKLNREQYKVRFLVERLNAWLKAFRRIRIRRDYKPSMFKAFVYLAFIIILLR